MGIEQSLEWRKDLARLAQIKQQRKENDEIYLLVIGKRASQGDFWTLICFWNLNNIIMFIYSRVFNYIREFNGNFPTFMMSLNVLAIFVSIFLTEIRVSLINDHPSFCLLIIYDGIFNLSIYMGGKMTIHISQSLIRFRGHALLRDQARIRRHALLRDWARIRRYALLRD